MCQYMCVYDISIFYFIVVKVLPMFIISSAGFNSKIDTPETVENNTDFLCGPCIQNDVYDSNNQTNDFTTLNGLAVKCNETEFRQNFNIFIQKRSAIDEQLKIMSSPEFFEPYLEEVCKNPNIATPCRIKRILKVIKTYKPPFGVDKLLDYFLCNRKILQKKDLLLILMDFFIECVPCSKIVEKIVNKKVKDSILKSTLKKFFKRNLETSIGFFNNIMAKKDIIDSGILYHNYGLTLQYMLSDFCVENSSFDIVELMGKLENNVFDTVLPMTLFTKNTSLIDSYMNKLYPEKIVYSLPENAPLEILLSKAFELCLVPCFRKIQNVENTLSKIYGNFLSLSNKENIYKFCYHCSLYWPKLYSEIMEKEDNLFILKFLRYLNNNNLFSKNTVYWFWNNNGKINDLCKDELYYMTCNISLCCFRHTIVILGIPKNQKYLMGYNITESCLKRTIDVLGLPNEEIIINYLRKNKVLQNQSRNISFVCYLMCNRKISEKNFQELCSIINNKIIIKKLKSVYGDKIMNC